MPPDGWVVSFFRKRELPFELAQIYLVFEDLLVDVEAAKDILVSSVPQARLPGHPLDEALEIYRAKLQSALGRMSGWLVEETAGTWRACDQALAQAIDAAGSLLSDIDPEVPLGFQEHLELVQELVDLLEPFGDAEERFRELRR